MADTTVAIKLTVDGADQASEALGSVGESADKSDSKISSLASKGLTALKTSLIGLGTTAVASSAALVKSSVSAYADLEQS